MREMQSQGTRKSLLVMAKNTKYIRGHEKYANKQEAKGLNLLAILLSHPSNSLNF